MLAVKVYAPLAQMVRATINYGLMPANLKNEKFYLKLITSGSIEVHRNGTVFNKITGKELGRETGRDSYRKLSWLNPKTRKIVQVQLHRIVWAAFKGIPKDPKLVINHKDGNKQNCRLSNLELVTCLVNSIHAIAIGLLDVTLSQAENNSQAIFRNSQVCSLRRRFAHRLIDVSHIMDKYFICRTTVTTMLRGITYKSIITGYEEICSSILKENPMNRRS